MTDLPQVRLRVRSQVVMQAARAGPGARLVAAAAVLVLAGCAVGPDYVRPVAPVGEAYKEAGEWTPARPRDDVDRRDWWRVFEDAQLASLLEQVAVSNQNVALARAQYMQARAIVQQAKAAFLPSIGVQAAATRSKQSGTLGPRPAARGTFSTYDLFADVSWQLDLFGGAQRGYEAAQTGAQAAAADVAAVLLSMRAELAQDYFSLRALDAQRDLLEKTVVAYERSLQMARNRYTNGVVSRADVAQAETQLRATQAQAIDVAVQRAQFEHAVAVLTGKPPSQFALTPEPLIARAPDVPVGLPGDLLERRPDVAAAERRVAAANAQIGIAVAAYFPTLTLGAQGGFETTDLGRLLSAPSRFWSIGPTIAQTIFDAGLRRARTAQARAAYDASVAAYRQTVLTSLQEVEDNLAALRILAHEDDMQAQAVAAAEQSLTLTINQYKAGVVSYLEVVTAQTIALANKRTAVDIRARRMLASVLLVRALGGGWDAAQAMQARDSAGSAPTGSGAKDVDKRG